MKRCVGVVGLGVLLGLPAQAQNAYPRFELFGGYSFAHTDLSTRFTPALNGHGWAASLSANFHKQFGITTDISGHYGDIPNPSFRCLFVSPQPPECSRPTKVHTVQLLFGPRLTMRYDRLTWFAHLLAGAVETRIGSYTEPGFMFGETTVPPFDVPARSQADFAMGFGLGIDVRASDRWAARLFQGDYIPVRGGGLFWFDNVRLRAGVVFKFSPH